MEADLKDITQEALFLLNRINPLQASLLWQHVVEGYTEEELARRFGMSERNVRRLVNGYTRKDGETERYVWGAKDWMSNIIDLFVEADRCEGQVELSAALAYGIRSNPWGIGFPVTLLGIFWEVMDCDHLKRFLTTLASTRIAGSYAKFMRVLQECFDEDLLKLCRCFAGLCPAPQRDCAIRIS